MNKKLLIVFITALVLIISSITLAGPVRLNPAPADKGREFEKVVRKDPMLPVLVDVLYDYDKRVRVLESRPAITKAQFRTALKNMFKNR